MLDKLDQLRILLVSKRWQHKRISLCTSPWLQAAAHRTEPGAAARDGPPGLGRPGSAPSRADSTASGVSATSATSAPVRISALFPALLFWGVP
jgi:hypothetical protein